MGEAVVHGRDNRPVPSVHAVTRPQRVLSVDDETAMLRALRINLRARAGMPGRRQTVGELTRRP